MAFRSRLPGQANSTEITPFACVYPIDVMSIVMNTGSDIRGGDLKQCQQAGLDGAKAQSVRLLLGAGLIIPYGGGINAGCCTE